MFESIIGYDYLKSELQMFCDLIVNPDKYKKLGIDTSKNVFLKNVLLEGPPGTGKTSICKDLMNALSDKIKTFFIVRDKSDGEFVKEINKVFDQAKESENGALIFFDDINLFNINEDSEPIVAVKTGIDQCADNDRIFCIGTCNDSEDFSPAFVRRWKILQMLHPNKKDGVKIIEHYLAHHPLVDDINVDDICHMVAHYSCYELQNLIDSASIFAAYKGKNKVDIDDIKQVIFTDIFDLSSTNDEPDEREEETILHECFHAGIMELLEPKSCGYIAVSPQGTKYSGVTYSCSRSTRRPVSVLVSLASKVGIELLMGKVASGCQADIQRAIRTIREGLTNAIIGIENTPVFQGESQSETMKNKIENTVHSELQRYTNLCKKILLDGQNLDFVKELASSLKEKRMLLYSDIQAIKAHFNLKCYDV